jgi:predicted DNA-binding transcriptional regulator AlpA
MVRTLLTSTSPLAGAEVKKRTAQPLVGIERVAWTVKRWSQESDLSVPTVWEMIKRGQLPSVKIGGRRLIRISPGDYMDACAAAAAAAAASAAE